MDIKNTVVPYVIEQTGKGERSYASWYGKSSGDGAQKCVFSGFGCGQSGRIL